MTSDLRTELRRRAEETRRAILSAARAEAERLTAEANQVLEERRSAVLRTKEEEYRALARTEIAAARHEAMREMLLGKTRLADRVLTAARARLAEAARSEPYLKRLPAELDEALAFVGNEGATVRSSEELATVVADALEGRSKVTVEALEGGANGFVVIGANDSVRVDGTLETRLDRQTAALSIAIHKLLEAQ